MADNEDDSGSSRTITPAEPPSSSAQAHAADSTQPEDAVLPAPVARSAEEADGTEGVTDEQRGNSLHAESVDQSGQPGHEEQAMPAAAGESSQLVDFLQTCPEEQSIVVGADLTSLGPDMSNTTIIYVQPDGSLVEGSGLTPEEQQSLLEQLTKQQVVQVSDSEAAQLLQQSQAIKTTTVQNAALNPTQLQQVISQVTKSQHQVQALQQTVKQVVQVQTAPQSSNVSQQLKSSSTIQVGQKKSEPVRIQIQALPKQEVKPRPVPQHANQTVSQPQVTLSANGSAQIIHIQPVVGQQGQQLFLQQNLGDPPIQLLLQSPSPVVGSLLPLVHKLPAQTSSGVVSPAAHKHVSSSVPVTSAAKTPPTPAAKFASVSLIKTPANGAVTTSAKSPVKVSAAAKTCEPGASPTPAPLTPPSTAGRALLAPPPTTKDAEKEKKKVKKREKKAVKVQTRSGRVSRPPKYKAKDYKFIKTEDLAESHQSDSDDYSDMSMEEEEREVGRKDDSALDDSMSLTYSHKSRSHRCQTCDKAYIGPGGLNRHYKLNPSHGEPEPSCDTPHAASDESQSQEPACVAAKEELNDDKAVAEATSTESGLGAAGAFQGLHHRGPGRPRGRGRGRGRGRSLGSSLKFPQVSGGFIRRGGRRGRPPKLGIAMATAEQQVERRRERLQELVDQCEDEELMDIVLPRLTKVLSVWEMLLAKVERAGPPRSHFPDIYKEFESLQTHVRQAAQDYIMAPLGGASPLEIRNIEVARCLGILDEVNRMKVLPGASPASSLSTKNSRYMENSKMLPPSKRFKMENSVPLHQNGIERTVVNPASGENPTSSVVSTPPPIPSEAKVCSSTATDLSRSTGPTESPSPVTPMEVTAGNHQKEEVPLTEAQNQSQQVNSQDKSPPASAQTPESCPVQDVAPVCQTALELVESCQTKELEEGQEIYIQTEGMTVQLAEPGEERIVIVNGPDGTTMHIQTPEGVPLEAVQALLGIEASDGSKPT
uniref:uncharacterized protein LOC131140313 isoform X1 n=1 Tax=Doryrhamphus excisus TaxID=161450 RepID=UPI0025AD9F98|nr:uncharacterized protein LOC131140313 isoform X1 [Doryrhamphus excisus]